jgi:hypothetical protein
MKYQLVLQWSFTNSLNEYDTMIGIENLLIEKLTDKSKVDGHDAGSGETNIFIYTDNPQRTLDEITRLLSGHTLWPEMRIAHRQDDGTEYTALKPKGLTGFSVK